jgi:DNA-binding ferritin-like protein (Dps family)
VPNLLKKMIGDKREWRQMQARAAALPHDYQIVYDEMMKYMFRFSAGSGMDTVALLKDLLGLFEGGAADGRRALEVTGEDVAAFSDELLRNAKTYTAKWHAELNRDVMQRLRNEKTEQ